MTRLDVICDERTAARTDVILRSAPNWTVVLFFAGLGMLHLYLAAAAFTHARLEGFLSLIFGLAFCGMSLISRLIISEIAVLSAQKCVRHRVGWRWLSRQKYIP